MRLLLSARDTGAAQAIEALYAEARSKDRVSVTVVASDPAARYFEERGIQHTRVDWGSAVCPTFGHRIVAEAERFLRKTSVDAIITGLSGPAAGLDEAMVAAASCPTFAVQDYWGDVNQGFGHLANYFLVLDWYACEVTASRGVDPKACYPVGSVKHAHLAERAETITEEAADWRSRLGIEDNKRLVLFCGQPLWDHSGYAETVEAVCKTVASRSDAVLVYRPHPAELNPISNFQRACGGELACADASCDLYAALAACDANLSVFSSCGWDQLVLAQALRRPLGGVGYVLCEPGMRNLLLRMTGMATVPPTSIGVAEEIPSCPDLGDALDRLLDAGNHRRAHERIAAKVPDPRHSALCALDFIERTVKMGNSPDSKLGDDHER